MFKAATESPKLIIVVQHIFLSFSQGIMYLIPHVLIAEVKAKLDCTLID